MSWGGLSGLLWMLAIGGLLYWMMRRGGCGMAGHSHGGGHVHGGGAGPGHAGHERGSPSVRDPVCGMTVGTGRAAGTRSFEGRTFYLCSPSCIERFDGDPATYARRASEEGRSTAAHAGHGHRGCC